MRILFLALVFLCSIQNLSAQNVSIDGRLKSHLDNFFELCKEYNIDYHEKLFKLKNIAIVDTLQTSLHGSTLGMVQRNKQGNIENIVVNWVTLLDEEIVKVVAYHEFAHYFLEYTEHVCNDCGIIMSKVNSSYFDIVNDWDNQIKILFEQSPAFQRKKNEALHTVAGINFDN
ncbi:hypothetical protein [Cochleicola gelatinilyticus]|uniref:SprT-like domain-containing protein n=1 Tax=Cochleicola gelatinilyticus TaxID=1763537 RepID=A0A167HPJ8_9FLAO|nr:hypothetical protein [Cochleicola gelatinilyticus]OAB78828.1 hypothetical protein ULVI_09615 [Cochleicola gelatinilyticus]